MRSKKNNMNKLFSTVGVLLLAVLFSFQPVSAQEKPYKDVTPAEAYKMAAGEEATLIDVRAPEEWDLVGHPGENKKGEGRELAGRVLFIPWNFYSGQRNDNFIATVKESFPDPATPLMLMCRSGNRSASAAKALHEAGYTNLYNVATGFEGNPDPRGYRNQNGWKVDGLPYKYGKP